MAGQSELFVTADRCIACHNALASASGEDISIGAHWRSSMMANAARDPYWHAAVRREILIHPTASEAIQHECSACHMPMMRYHAKLAGSHGGVFANLPVNPQQSPGGLLAVDGVSCTICHQITPDHFGEKESFTAGFTIDYDTPPGQRSINGPFEVDAGRQHLMHSATVYTLQKSHVQESELCATCHTLFTHALDDQGQVVGELPEQVPYLEWRHSAFAGDRSCQSCHMPEVEGKAKVSGVSGLEHENVSRHSFRGGNFLMPRIFNRHRGELGVAALPQELEGTSASGKEPGQCVGHSDPAGRRTFRRYSAGRSTGQQPGRAQTAHGLPFAAGLDPLHGAERQGRASLRIGELNTDGSIAGNDNDADGGTFEPHYDLIDRPARYRSTNRSSATTRARSQPYCSAA